MNALTDRRERLADEHPDWTQSQVDAEAARELEAEEAAQQTLDADAEHPEPGADDTHDDDGTDTLPAGLRGRLKFPEDTRGHYVVLWAAKPPRSQRPDYHEIACVPAHDPDHAKRIVLEADGRSPRPVAERGDVARWLIERAHAKGGILLRAVPAQHWPRNVEPTSMHRPEPVLKIG